MAEPISAAALAALPVTPYAQIRASLRTGDLVFAAGEGLVSRAIRRGTGSAWSHVGLIVRFDTYGRVLVLESMGHVGVRFAPLSTYLSGDDVPAKFAGCVALARHRWAAGNPLDAGISWGLDQLTQPYDNFEAIAIVFRELFRVGRHVRDDTFVCSELVEEIYRRAGYQIPWNGAGYITPADVWTDPAVTLLARVL